MIAAPPEPSVGHMTAQHFNVPFEGEVWCDFFPRGGGVWATEIFEASNFRGFRG